jgi:short-subunit dehydrogenase
MTATRPLAVVTGASSGIGYELAIQCAKEGFDLVVAADDPTIRDVVGLFRTFGTDVIDVEADLATPEGVEALEAAVGGRPVDALLANAAHGLGGAFLDQRFDEIRHVIDTNLTGTLDLVQRIGRHMRDRGQGKILLTGSVAGPIPGPYSAVYTGTKAFINSFSLALRAELMDAGVTVTCLMPGATDTDFFERAGMEDTKLGREEKDDPGGVARAGFDAMMRGDADIVSGWRNRLQTAMASVAASGLPAERPCRHAEPRSADPETVDSSGHVRD